MTRWQAMTEAERVEALDRLAKVFLLLGASIATTHRCMAEMAASLDRASDE